MTEEKINEKPKSYAQFEELAQIKQIWGDLDTSKESFRNVEEKLKDLKSTFKDAVEQGADPETLKKILGEWQMEKLKLDTMTQTLNQAPERDRPDIMKDYISNSYNELGKGVHILNEKTKGLVENAKEGIIKTGKALTEKISELNSKVKEVFKEKQQELAVKFEKGLDLAKDKLSEKSLDVMVNTAKMAEAFDRSHGRSKEELQSGIKATLNKQNDLLDKNNENLARKFQSIDESKYTTASRLKAGVETIKDTLQGKEYKEHKPEEKSVADLGKEYQRAMSEASRNTTSIQVRTSLKVNALKAWSKLEQGVASVGAKLSRGINKAVSIGIDKYGSKDLKEKMQEIQKDTKDKEPIKEGANKDTIKKEKPIKDEMAR